MQVDNKLLMKKQSTIQDHVSRLSEESLKVMDKQDKLEALVENLTVQNVQLQSMVSCPTWLFRDDMIAAFLINI